MTILLTLNMSDPRHKSCNFTHFKQHSQSGHIWLPLLTCSTCVTYRTPCHTTGHQVLLTHPLPWVLPIWESVFLLSGVFYLALLPVAWRFSWGQQLNLKISRASCWLSKHSPGPTIVSNDSSRQEKYTGWFYLCT